MKFEKTLCLLVFVFLTAAYLFPGSQHFFENRTDVILSDGTDPTAAAHQHGMILHSFERSPLNFFYGAVPVVEVGAPDGEMIWNQWLERWTILAMSPIFVLEQLNSAWIFLLMVFSGLAMVGMGRMWGWPIPVAWGIGLAWAFSASMRARAKVHSGFVGNFHLPLIILAFLILVQGRSKRSVGLAGLCLLLASGAPHYYLIMTAFAAPIFLWVYLTLDSRPWKKSLGRLLLASMPAVLSVVYTFMNAAPADFLNGRSAFPNTGVSAEWPHPFLEIFAARPLDYFTGDTGAGLADINPLKAWLNAFNFELSPIGNMHERTNGVRWLVWFLALIVVFSACRRSWGERLHLPLHSDPSIRRMVFPLVALIVFGFWLSLPPSYLGPSLTPAVWVNSVISQFRVSSRAGIFVHFGLLLLVGLGLTLWAQKARASQKKWLWLFPVLIVLELPPFFQNLPVAVVQRPYSEMQKLTYEDCGTGMSFPYYSSTVAMMDYFSFLEKMRGSKCRVLNGNTGSPQDLYLATHFGLSDPLIRRIQGQDENLKNELSKFVSCSGLTWIAFDTRMDSSWAADVCGRLQGQLTEQGICRRMPSNLGPLDSSRIQNCIR